MNRTKVESPTALILRCRTNGKSTWMPIGLICFAFVFFVVLGMSGRRTESCCHRTPADTNLSLAANPGVHMLDRHMDHARWQHHGLLHAGNRANHGAIANSRKYTAQAVLAARG